MNNATIVVAACLANTEHILQEPALMGRFRRCPPPPDLNVPIPHSNLATITGFDDETLRRRVNQLCGMTVLAKDGQGITIHPAFYASEEYRTLELFSRAAIIDLLRRILVFDTAVEFFAKRYSATIPDVDLLNSLLADSISICHSIYIRNFVRIVMDRFIVFGDTKITSYVGYGFVVECLRPLSNNRALSLKFGMVDTPAPDSAKTPISIRKMAGLLELPVETVRRHVAILQAGNVLTAVGGGYVPTTAAVMNGDIMLWQASLVSRMTRQIADAFEALPHPRQS